MGNEQMRKLKNIFSERKERSSFIRLHQSYDPTKKEQNFVGSPPSCLVDVLHEAKVDEKAFIYLVRKGMFFHSTFALLWSLKMREDESDRIVKKVSSLFDHSTHTVLPYPIFNCIMMKISWISKCSALMANA